MVERQDEGGIRITFVGNEFAQPPLRESLFSLDNENGEVCDKIISPSREGRPRRTCHIILIHIATDRSKTYEKENLFERKSHLIAVARISAERFMIARWRSARCGRKKKKVHNGQEHHRMFLAFVTPLSRARILLFRGTIARNARYESDARENDALASRTNALFTCVRWGDVRANFSP